MPRHLKLFLFALLGGVVLFLLSLAKADAFSLTARLAFSGLGALALFVGWSLFARPDEDEDGDEAAADEESDPA